MSLTVESCIHMTRDYMTQNILIAMTHSHMACHCDNISEMNLDVVWSRGFKFLGSWSLDSVSLELVVRQIMVESVKTAKASHFMFARQQSKRQR